MTTASRAPGQKRLRVWVVTPELHREGGTERSVAEQLERWTDRFEMRLFTMRARDVRLEGVPVHSVPMPPGPHIGRYIWWLVANRAARWRAARRLGKPDVLYSPGVNALDADAVSVHIVFARHWEETRSRALGDLAQSRSAFRSAHRIAYWALVRLLERRIYGGPVSLWALSMADARLLEDRYGRPSGTVPVVPHGVDTTQFSPRSRSERRMAARARLGLEGDPVVLLVSNDHATKGADVAVRALVELPGVTLCVAGRDGAPLVAQARALGVLDRLRVLPPTPQVLDYYAAADVLVAPSREDAFGLPPMEAMACGLPVAVSHRAGVAQLVTPGEHALVIDDPEDHAALAATVRNVLADSSLAQRLSEGGRKLAQRCSWEANASRAAELLEHEVTAPRLLVLATSPGETGGIGRATRELLRASVEQWGAERVSTVAVWGGSETAPLPGWVLDAGVAPRGTGVPLRRRLSFALRAARVARRWRKRLVIVATHPHLAPVARVASRVSGAPYAVWTHGLEVWGPTRRPVRRALCAADAVWAGSEFTASRVREQEGVDAARLALLRYCLPRLPPPREVEARPGQVLAVARLTRADAYKGVDTLLLAWPHVLRRVPGARLVIVGEGDDRARLERLAAHLHLGDRVCFAGRLSDEELADTYARSVVFALPGGARLDANPAGEGFGLVFIEAAAAGLPVVAGRAGGAPEALDDGATGVLVDPEQVEEVAEAIAALLLDSLRAQRMGAAGRRFAAEHHSREGFQATVASLMRQLQSRR